MLGGVILTISVSICAFMLGCGATWLVMRLRMDAARSTAMMFSQWWMAAEDRLDEAHANHVRAGKARHAPYRAKVRAKCAEISAALPKGDAR